MLIAPKDSHFVIVTKKEYDRQMKYQAAVREQRRKLIAEEFKLRREQDQEKIKHSI